MSENRLPQVGEVWWNESGLKVRLCEFQDSATQKRKEAIGCPLWDGTRSYMPSGAWSETIRHMGMDLVLIHKDASGKVINPVFDPALIGQPDAQGKPAKPPKPDPLAQAIAETKERLAGLEDLQAKLSRQTKDKAEAKALAAEIAALRAKWPIEPKAAKAGRKGK